MNASKLLFLPCALLLASCTATQVKQTQEVTEKVDHAADLSEDHESLTHNCVGYGPQTPRDIDSKAGNNKRIFSLAPPPSSMNLCNIHFHKNAEHRANAFSIYAGDGDGKGYDSGYRCGIGESLSAAELKPMSKNMCKGIKPGDTVEVHWVHTSCDVAPGEGLGSCLSDSCATPNLRVETQVFVVVNDKNAMNFNQMDYDGNMVNGYHQAKSLPTGTGEPVQFLGSTTGPSYDNKSCSAIQATWSVRPQCAKLDINSLSDWCANNEFAEVKAHGVRKLVTHPDLLSEIK